MCAYTKLVKSIDSNAPQIKFQKTFNKQFYLLTPFMSLDEITVSAA